MMRLFTMNNNYVPIRTWSPIDWSALALYGLSYPQISVLQRIKTCTQVTLTAFYLSMTIAHSTIISTSLIPSPSAP
jgi:hypothetical protein